jgi:hypothetical protein
MTECTKWCREKVPVAETTLLLVLLYNVYLFVRMPQESYTDWSCVCFVRCVGPFRRCFFELQFWNILADFQIFQMIHPKQHGSNIWKMWKAPYFSFPGQ